LYTDANQTYIGATVNPDRRLRQHNQEISGGAHATGKRVRQGHTWKRACVLENIPEWRSALQIEWKWKQLGRTKYKHIANPLMRRMHSLKYLLSCEKPTKNSIPFDAYPDGPPSIKWDNNELQQRYDAL
jgi:predicted GIY-YIG superfamily endonuclease